MKTRFSPWLAVVVLSLLVVAPAWTQQSPPPRAAVVAPQPPLGPTPTLENVPYGPDVRNVLDFWRAPSSQPTPIVIYIHGGGFTDGDKTGARREALLQACLDAGVSFAAINYRYLSAKTPMPEVLHDCARAVQFIRAQSGTWNLDSARVAAYGGSAGAGISLWLAFHDDLTEAGSADLIRRESTRLVCAGAMSPQCSYDPVRWTSLFGDEALQRYGGTYRAPQLFGFATEADLRGPAGAKVRAECDMLGMISADDPPVFLEAAGRGLALTSTNQLLHHPKHALALHLRCRDVGVPDVAIIPAYDIAPRPGEPATWREFLFRRLGVSH